MNEIFIIDVLRTPFGSFSGALATITAPQRAATAGEVVAAIFERL